MKFARADLHSALIEWRSKSGDRARAESDNLWFETRVSDRRRSKFENEIGPATSSAALRNGHTDYWETYIKVDEDLPDTFAKSLDPAGLGIIDETQSLVRIEAIDRPLHAHGMTYPELRRALDDNDGPAIDGFLRVWNKSHIRDNRPAFATFKSEVIDDLALPTWPVRLRDRLGLAHYDCMSGPVPIALMQYTVKDVLNAATAIPDAAPLTVPTALDSGPWPFFFPSPASLAFGRTMALYEVADDADMLAEILHLRIEYRRANLIDVGQIDADPDPVILRSLRNHHLWALRIAASADDFGEEMP